MWSALLFLASASANASDATGVSVRCIEKRRPLLELSLNQFDQDPNGGWRKVAEKEECKADAAELIAQYREHLQSRMTSLYWHEGQIRAEIGETNAAVRLMKRAKHPEVSEGISQADWNAYVDATIAFLQSDRSALIAARHRLIATASRGNSQPPLNLNVVNALLRCFGQSYRTAYHAERCQPEAAPRN